MKESDLKMGLELYMSFNVSHSSQPNVRSAGGAIDYAEREEMQDIKKEIEDIKEKTTGIDYIERQRTSDVFDLENKMKLMQEYKSDFVTSKSFNIPSWAEGKDVRPSKYFFQASEKREPPGWNNYHEFKVAIPNETTDAQAMKMGQDIMDKSGLCKNAYTVAIHDKEASLAINGVHNRHLHIVFSDRIQDKHNRSEEQYFKSYAHKNIDKGGCKKDTRFTVGIKQIEENTKAIRRNIADVINEFYKENDIDKYVDARKHEEILAEAIKNKDYNLIELLSVETQEHMGGYKIELLKKPDKFTKEIKSLQIEMAKLIVIKEQIQTTGNMIEKLPELEKYIGEYGNRINNVTDKITSLDEIVSARYDVEKRTQPIMDNKPIKVSIEKLTSIKELDKQIEKVSKKIGTLEKTVSSMLDTINIKEKRQAIKDRQTIEGMSGDKLVKIVEDLPSVRKLEKQIAEYTLHINKITDRIQGRIDEVKEIIKTDIVGVKALHLDITIENKTRAISTNIEKSCLREYMNSIKKLPDYLEHDKNIRSLVWHKEQIAEKKVDLKNTKLSDRKELNIIKNRIGALERTALSLENKIDNFNKKYVNDNPKIEDFKPQVMANNLSLEKHIAKLKDRKKELLNPFMKEVALEREQLADEYIKFQEIKNEFLSEPKPKFYEKDKLKAWDINLKEFDKLDEEFKQRENSINEKASQPISMVEPKEAIEKKINILENTFKQTELEINTKIENFASDTITTAQALEATLAHLKEVTTQLRHVDHNLKNINSQYIHQCDAEKMAKEKFIGSPLKEAETEQLNINKEEHFIELAKDVHMKNVHDFGQMAKPKWHEMSYSTTYKETEKALHVEADIITKREAALASRKTNNDKQFADIELKCKTLDARSKIDKMVENILAPNKTLSLKKTNLSTQKKDLSGQFSTFTKMKTVFEKQLSFETAQSRKNKTPEKKYIAKITIRDGSSVGGGSVGNPSLLRSLANAMNPVANISNIGFKFGDENLDFDWISMTPDQIEMAVAKISRANDR